MPFEQFKRQRAPVATEPSITIQKRGNLSLNPAAYELLERPEAVELLYDRERRLIGLRGAEPGTEYAYVVRPLSSKSATTNWLVSGMAFAAYYGIDTEIARRWTCRVEGDLLVIDLNEPGQEVSSNRDRKARNADAASANGASPSQPGPIANGSPTAAAQASPQVQQTPGGVGT